MLRKIRKHRSPLFHYPNVVCVLLGQLNIWPVLEKQGIHSLCKGKRSKHTDATKHAREANRNKEHIAIIDKQCCKASHYSQALCKDDCVQQEVHTDCAGRSERTPPPTILFPSETKMRHECSCEGA